MFEADLPERFNYLAAAIIDTVRFADEGNQGITIRASLRITSEWPAAIIWLPVFSAVSLRS